MTSRKSTFWRWPLTEKRALCGRRDGKAYSVRWPSRKSAFRERAAPRVRFSVRVCSQSALFCRMRLFSPGQMSRCLTQKRTLSPSSHGKAHSGSPPYPLRPDVSRKDALWRGVCRSHRLLSLTLMDNGATTSRYGLLESSVLLALLGRAERYTRTSVGSLRSSSPT